MIKNIFHITLALLLVSISFPIFILLSIIIWIETGENPIYVQKRGITLHNRFDIYKFRTLKKNNNTLTKNIFYKNELNGQVTNSGRILRITGLDELPQVFNVIKGEMSLIGPRPLSINDLSLLKENEPNLYRRRTAIKSKPGISGMWQVYGDRNKGAEDLINLDELYEKKNNLLTDIYLLIKTVPLVLTAKHSDSIVSFTPKKIFNSLIKSPSN